MTDEGQFGDDQLDRGDDPDDIIDALLFRGRPVPPLPRLPASDGVGGSFCSAATTCAIRNTSTATSEACEA